MSNYAEWIARAENDLADIRNNLAAAKFPGDTVTFHAHQAIEKILKAFCLFNGSDPGKIHDVGKLLHSATAWAPQLASYSAQCGALTAVYLASRYPVAPPPSEAVARSYAAVAEEIFRSVRALLP